MGKIFDDVFRTLCEKNSKLLIPLINEVFHRDYKMTEKIELWAGEHHVLAGSRENLDKRITDSAVHIGNNLYHLECQSNPDGSMVLRMVEYDFHIALENAVEMESGYEMWFPESAVLYLRHREDTPDKIQMTIRFPENSVVTYSVPVIKTQQYTEEDILGKQLYFLIPYYILRYEDASGADALAEISREYRSLYQGMADARDAGLLNEYDMTNIIDFTSRLIEHVFRNNQDMRSEVNAVMGGEVLETYADRMIAKGREKGRVEGREEGREEGRAQGIEQGLLEGERKGKIDLLYEMNFTIAEIAEKLSISMEEVEEIIQKD